MESKTTPWYCVGVDGGPFMNRHYNRENAEGERDLLRDRGIVASVMSFDTLASAPALAQRVAELEAALGDIAVLANNPGDGDDFAGNDAEIDALRALLDEIGGTALKVIAKVSK